MATSDEDEAEDADEPQAENGDALSWQELAGQTTAEQANDADVHAERVDAAFAAVGAE